MFALCCHDYSNKETPWIMLGISYSFFPWNGCSLTFSVRVNDVLGHKAMENAFQSDDGCVALCTPSQPASVFSSWLMSGYFLSSGTFSLQILFGSKHHLILSPPSPPSLSLSLSLSPGFTPMAKVIRDLVSGEPDSQESRYEHETT